jgi:hypothetical protein
VERLYMRVSVRVHMPLHTHMHKQTRQNSMLPRPYGRGVRTTQTDAGILQRHQSWPQSPGVYQNAEMHIMSPCP